MLKYMEFKKYINFWTIIASILSLFLLFGFITSILKDNDQSSKNNLPLIETAFAQEIYPLFECPCCGKAIDDCSCPMAKERRTYEYFCWYRQNY